MIGTVTAELSYPPGPLSRYLLYFRNIETREEGFLSAYPGGVDNGVTALHERRKSVGWTFDMPLAPGRYEFFNYWGVASGAFGSSEWSPKTPFSVPFAVEAGKTYYLGEYRAYPNMGENLFGMSLPYGGYFVVRDQEARDVPLVAQQRKTPIDGEVVNIVPDPKPANTPFLRASPTVPFN